MVWGCWTLMVTKAAEDVTLAPMECTPGFCPSLKFMMFLCNLPKLVCVSSNVSRCTGRGIWQDRFQCTACKPCASGFTHAALCNGLSFNDSCVECPDCNPGYYKRSSWDNATSRTTCACTPCSNNRTCPSTSQFRTFQPCTGKANYDQTCAECPDDSCPTIGTTPNYTNCIDATRLFQCLPCPSNSPTEPGHMQRVNCTTCPANNCSFRPGSYLVSRCQASSNKTFTCGLCEGCSVRTYMGQWNGCDGTGNAAAAFSNGNCRNCMGVCNVGQYLGRLCSGRDLVDVEKQDGIKCM